METAGRNSTKFSSKKSSQKIGNEERDNGGIDVEIVEVSIDVSKVDVLSL